MRPGKGIGRGTVLYIPAKPPSITLAQHNANTHLVDIAMFKRSLCALSLCSDLVGVLPWVLLPATWWRSRGLSSPQPAQSAKRAPNHVDASVHVREMQIIFSFKIKIRG